MATCTSPIRELGFCHLPLMRSLTYPHLAQHYKTVEVGISRQRQSTFHKSSNCGHKVHWNYNCKPGHYHGFMGGGEGELILEAGWQKLCEGTKVLR